MEAPVGDQPGNRVRGSSMASANSGNTLETAMRDAITTMVVPIPAGDGEKLQEHESCELSGFDQLMPNIYVPLLLLFDSGPRSAFLGLVEELKQSLAKVLVPFYPMAGRVVQRPGQPPHLLCNNAGAVFTSAHVEAPMSQVCGAALSDFQPVPQLSGISTTQETEEEKPALVVQVTGFQCGGVALAVNWLHTVADGFSASQFLKAWSEACGSGIPTSTRPPEHQRAKALKKAQILQAGAFSDQDLAADYTPPGLEGLAWTRDMAAAAEAMAAFAPTFQADNSSARLLQYTEAGIRKLKALAAADKGQDFSTVTCVSAHLWRCLTRAKLQMGCSESEGNGARPCIFVAAVDAKARRTGTGPDTLLAGSYFGNSIAPLRTREVEPEEVVRQPLGFAASLINDSVAGFNLRTFQYFLALADKHGPCNVGFMPRGVAHDVVASSWYRYPLYDLHFCFPAQPVLAVSNFSDNFLVNDFVVLLPSPLGPNNLTAMLMSDASVIANLHLDQEFLEYAS